MPLDFYGVDPDTGNDHSPTVWVDPGPMDIIVQGWEADDALLKDVADTPAPGHTPGVPLGEAVIRIPARMVPALRKACDAAEAAQLRRAAGQDEAHRPAPGNA
jgi:hypothetical protein